MELPPLHPHWSSPAYFVSPYSTNLTHSLKLHSILNSNLSELDHSFTNLAGCFDHAYFTIDLTFMHNGEMFHIMFSLIILYCLGSPLTTVVALGRASGVKIASNCMYDSKQNVVCSHNQKNANPKFLGKMVSKRCVCLTKACFLFSFPF